MGVDLVFWVWLVFWCWELVVSRRRRQLLNVLLLRRRLEPAVVLWRWVCFEVGYVGEVLGLCWSGLPPTCSYPLEAAVKALTAMLVGSLGNRQRPVWRDVFGLRLALGTLGSTAGGQLCRWC